MSHIKDKFIVRIWAPTAQISESELTERATESMATTKNSDLVAQLRQGHHQTHALCDRLEEIADALPDNINRRVCEKTALTIEPILLKAHSYEEEFFFPALASYHHISLDHAKLIRRLSTEHYEDRCFGEEVRDVLLSYSVGKPVQAPDATGYMLRGFFENLRRHMWLEEELARPLRDNKKTAPDTKPDAAE